MGALAIAWSWLRARSRRADPAIAAPTAPVNTYLLPPPGSVQTNPNTLDLGGSSMALPFTADLVNSFFSMGQPAAAPAAPVIPDMISLAEARTLARDIIRTHFGNRIDPAMVTAMIEIESGFRPKAYRYEAHLKDASYGLMQVLSKTARWLHDDLRYRGYSFASGEDLSTPAVGVYFGCAFIDWLRKHSFSDGTEDWIVMAYNGGPGNVGKFTTPNHLAKYKAAKTRQAQVK